jgi:ComF family protein
MILPDKSKTAKHLNARNSAKQSQITFPESTSKKNYPGRIKRAVYAALFPETCQACGKLLPWPETCDSGSEPGFGGGENHKNSFSQIFKKVLCKQCLADVMPVESPVCSCCGQPFDAGPDKNHECGRCIKTKPYFTKARSALLYSGSVLKLIHCYKYKNRTFLARPLGLLLYNEFVSQFNPASIDAVIPIPLHHRKLRSRGYNQALLIIAQWPKIAYRIGHSRNWKIIKDDTTILRKKNTSSQTGLNRRQRVKNISGAFMVRRPELVKGLRLLIVDDVYTTGSTVNECARVLRRAGAADVNVLTLARTP